MKKILIVLDYDSFAQNLAHIGYDLARAMNKKTVLLHVIPEATYYSTLQYSPILGFETLSNSNIVEIDKDSELLKIAEQFLEMTKESLLDDSVTTLVKTGELDDTVIKMAESGELDMIVIGSHHRKGMEKIFSGSTVEKILHHVQVPVLVVPVPSE